MTARVSSGSSHAITGTPSRWQEWRGPSTCPRRGRRWQWDTCPVFNHELKLLSHWFSYYWKTSSNFCVLSPWPVCTTSDHHGVYCSSPYRQNQENKLFLCFFQSFYHTSELRLKQMILRWEGHIKTTSNVRSPHTHPFCLTAAGHQCNGGRHRRH